ncbi:hypothetical protein DM860_006964 [Cuscuta australis]|uniref:Uncharacterized protein n=1 Tax=Cuscuta australis TaxID=267555 RepID=A0A328E5P9_9ASTE|nr:hypothetical protein DM860_006964 [Cuscuta australis]
MDFKRLGFSDQLSQYAASPSKKVASGWWLAMAATFVVASLFFLNSSVKIPFLFPAFQGLNSLGSRNSSSERSHLYWPFSFSPVSSCCSGAGSGDGSLMDSEGRRTGGIVDTHFGNFTENPKNESFDSKEEENPRKNYSQIGRSESFSNVIDKGIVSFEIRKNESVSGEGQNGTNAQNGTVDLLRMEMNFYKKECDIYDGEWVRDDTKPYYLSGLCPYIDRDFDCHFNKRPDDGYIKWKWQPYACDIPSFNSTDFLEKMRGKSLVIVGDSLNRNMWESLVCMLRAGVHDKNRVYEISGRSKFKKKGFYAFRFEDYNCSVDFVGSPFLVRESTFNGVNGSFETLRLDLMDQTTPMYNDADIMIFNTGHWWTHEKTSRREDYYQEGDHVHTRLKVLEAYKRALHTWARWVDSNVDPNRTQVIFRGYSATHFRGGRWNSGGQCHNETEPIFNKKQLAKYPSKMKALERVIRDMKTPVVYMNISRLTDYRKDGHPSVYRAEGHNGVHAQDCSHWCLPGVPDTWNELLYASLLKSGRGSWAN